MDRPGYQIRQVQPTDYAKLDVLIEQAFRTVPESAHQEQLLVRRIRDSEGWIPELSLVAELPGGKLLGHILLSEIHIVLPGGAAKLPALALAPLSVLPAYQKQGIGTALVCKAHARAGAAGFKLVVVLGHANYYPRFGYQRASAWDLSFPFAAPDECCLIAQLQEGALHQARGGTVRYPSVFFE